MVAAPFAFSAMTRTPIRHTPERRQSPRYELRLSVTAIIHDHNDPEHKRICSLNLLNLSDTGLAVLASEQIALGTEISLFLSPHAAEPAICLHGKIVRHASRRSGQYLLGIQFNQRRAA